jgi:hypothetical protein
MKIYQTILSQTAIQSTQILDSTRLKDTRSTSHRHHRHSEVRPPAPLTQLLSIGLRRVALFPHRPGILRERWDMNAAQSFYFAYTYSLGYLSIKSHAQIRLMNCNCERTYK